MVRMALPWVVLWRPEALDCRALKQPHALGGATRAVHQRARATRALARPHNHVRVMFVLFVVPAFVYCFVLFMCHSVHVMN